MATQTIEFAAASGQTITAKLFSAGSDTLISSVSATEATNRKGVYTAAFTDLAAGLYRLVGTNPSNVPLCQWWVSTLAATGTYVAYEMPIKLQAGEVWDVLYAQHTTAGTFGKLLDTLRKANYTTDGTVIAGATPTTTTFRTDLTQPDDTYDHQTLLFLSGNLEGESKPILSYQQANGVITLDEPLTEAPQIGDSFIILPIHVHPLSIIRSEIFGQEIESNLSMLQAQRLQSAILGALISGAGSGTEVFKAARNAATTRVTVTVDQSGNRTNIAYNLD